jgi:hypothetical protein
MIRKFLQGYSGQRQVDRREELKRALIRREAQIGGELFGPVPEGHRREFFCLDRHTWVWHEQWMENGQPKSITTRYEVRPDGILKTQGSTYKYVNADEGKRLYDATRMYNQRVQTELYAAVR